MSLAYDTSDTPVQDKYDVLLSKAVSRLPPASTELRHEIYARARAALRTQLRALQPPLPEIQIADEEHALDEAISRVEASATKNGKSATPPEQAQTEAGWLAKLLKRVSLEGEAKKPLEPPFSAIDFAPKRARESDKGIQPNLPPNRALPRPQTFCKRNISCSRIPPSAR